MQSYTKVGLNALLTPDNCVVVTNSQESENEQTIRKLCSLCQTQFKGTGSQTVVWPSSLASGTLIYPYANAKSRI